MATLTEIEKLKKRMAKVEMGNKDFTLMMSDRMLANEDNLRDLHGVVEQCESQIADLV